MILMLIDVKRDLAVTDYMISMSNMTFYVIIYPLLTFYHVFWLLSSVIYIKIKNENFQIRT